MPRSASLSVSASIMALLYVVSCSVYGLNAQADECEPAVDLLESNNAVNRIDECDYRDKGLNALFARGESEPDSTVTAKKIPPPAGKHSAAAAESAPAIAKLSAQMPSDRFQLTHQSINSAQKLLQARFSLIQQAGLHCEGAAVLSEEFYIPEEPGYIALNMSFYCQ